MRNLSITCFVAMALLGGVAFTARAAESKEDVKPEAKADAKTEAPLIGEPHTQTLKGFTYFYAGTRVNFQNIGDKLKALVPELQKAAAQAHAKIKGPMVLIYRGAADDPSADFDVEVGFPIAEKVDAAGEFKVREVADYPCMSVLYTGPFDQLRSAYEKLIPAVQSGTDKQSDETREMFLYFEGPQSPNNVVHISVGTK